MEINTLHQAYLITKISVRKANSEVKAFILGEIREERGYTYDHSFTKSHLALFQMLHHSLNHFDWT